MKPIKVTKADLVFGGKVNLLLPAMDAIPKDFLEKDQKWMKVITDWFYRGLNGAQWTPKEGIDTEEAIRHVQAILASFAPKHEHKIAGCAYLLSEFFEDVTYTTGKA